MEKVIHFLKTEVANSIEQSNDMEMRNKFSSTQSAIDTRNIAINNLKDYIGQCNFAIAILEQAYIPFSFQKPRITGAYDVITSRGRIIRIKGEKKLNKWVWETSYPNHNINEQVIAYRFVK